MVTSGSDERRQSRRPSFRFLAEFGSQSLHLIRGLMGNFYVNYTIRDVTQVELAAVMAGRRAIVSPESNGEVVVFDKASDRQDQKQITWLGAKLSGDLRRAVLRVLNHDDDILWYQLHIAGT